MAAEQGAPEPQAPPQAPEFMLLAIPNVMGVVTLLYLLYLGVMAAGPWRAGAWATGVAVVVLFCYLNVGEAEAGIMVDRRNARAGKTATAGTAAGSAGSTSWPVPPGTRCAFLGLGTMGAHMAANLCAAPNVTLSVWNRDEAVAQRHAEQHGSRACATVEEATRGADFVFVCLPTTAVVADVAKRIARGPKGKREKPVLVVDCTSGDPEESRVLAATLLGDKDGKGDKGGAEAGLVYVDAPVSGGPKGAEAGSLTVMVGAPDEEAFARVEPLLHVVGSSVVHVGPVGCGHAVKAVNNALNATALLMSAEGLLALAKFGVPPQVALSVINASSGRNLQTQERIPAEVLNGKFGFGFALGLMSKDNNIAEALLKSQSIPEGYLARSAALLRDACGEFGPDADYTRCVQVLEAQAKCELRNA